MTLTGYERAFNLLAPSTLKVSLDLSNVAEGSQQFVIDDSYVKLPSNLALFRSMPRVVSFGVHSWVSARVAVAPRTEGRPAARAEGTGSPGHTRRSTGVDMAVVQVVHNEDLHGTDRSQPNDGRLGELKVEACRAPTNAARKQSTIRGKRENWSVVTDSTAVGERRAVTRCDAKAARAIPVYLQSAKWQTMSCAYVMNLKEQGISPGGRQETETLRPFAQRSRRISRNNGRYAPQSGSGRHCDGVGDTGTHTPAAAHAPYACWAGGRFSARKTASWSVFFSHQSNSSTK